MKHYFGLFFSILIGVCALNENSATVLSARCKSRCLAKVSFLMKLSSEYFRPTPVAEYSDRL